MRGSVSDSRFVVPERTCYVEPVYIRVYSYIYIYIYIQKFVYVVCMCIYIYIYIYKVALGESVVLIIYFAIPALFFVSTNRGNICICCAYIYIRYI